MTDETFITGSVVMIHHTMFGHGAIKVKLVVQITLADVQFETI